MGAMATSLCCSLQANPTQGKHWNSQPQEESQWDTGERMSRQKASQRGEGNTQELSGDSECSHRPT